MYTISKPSKELKGTIHLPTSKSESNRLLISRSLCDTPFEIVKLSPAEDTQVLKKVLDSIRDIGSAGGSYDVGQAGTTMRFLTAYFAITPGKWTLTGSDRMKQRTIKVLVDALKELGAKIEYVEKEGFPPLKIEGTDLNGKTIEIDGSISSQFTSALLLIAPYVKNGITIRFKGKITSRPYINMTLKIMEQLNIKSSFELDQISVLHQHYMSKNLQENRYTVEGDWSSASYWYSIAALADEVDLQLMGLKEFSLQADAVLPDLFAVFGVKTEFIPEGVRLTKVEHNTKNVAFDFSDCPDLAQTFIVTASALNIPCLLNGLHTLKIKETDRVKALQNELKKIGVTAHEKHPVSLEIDPASAFHAASSSISTYSDHRIAMSFASLAMLNEVKIEDPEVVKKSYPDFWKDLKSVGFVVK